MFVLKWYAEEQQIGTFEKRNWSNFQPPRNREEGFHPGKTGGATSRLLYCKFLVGVTSASCGIILEAAKGR